MTTYIYAIASVLAVSLISFAGVFTLSMREAVLRKNIFLMVSLAVGALLGDAFIHLIPESFETIANPTAVSLAIIGGAIAFFITEKFLHWHHHAMGEHDHETVHPTGKLVLISDGVHNFIDGLIIGASFLVSTELGIATTLAVILHEIPQEIGDFGVLIHSGFSKVRALWFNFLSALTAVLGVVVALVSQNIGSTLSVWLVPIAAGGFIYIAMSDLVPELHKTKHPGQSILQLVAIGIGILAMVALLAFE